MKQCPACKKTFEDSMKFCQTDGTPLMPLVENVAPTPPADPFKTVVAGSQTKATDDFSIPVEHDPMKTMVASDLKKDIPQVSQPLNPPIFGDLSPTAPPLPPREDSATLIAPPETPNFDATFTSMPLPSDSPFGSSTNKPTSSPFDQPMSSPFDTPKYEPPPFKEPEPIYTSQNEPFGNPFGQPNNQMESAWTPPPAPDQNWANQGVGQNTPFQPPPIGIGQGQNQTLAIVSLVLGILSLFCCGWFIPGIIAVVLGFMAKKNAETNPNEYGGRGLALGGIITGGVSLLFGIILVLVYFLGFAASLAK